MVAGDGVGGYGGCGDEVVVYFDGVDLEFVGADEAVVDVGGQDEEVNPDGQGAGFVDGDSEAAEGVGVGGVEGCLLYTSPSPRD